MSVQMAKKTNIRKLTTGGVLAALVLLMTYLVKIPVPATGGYVHPGDGVIFLSGVLLGPYAALIGGIGSALADLLGGYFVYILPTFVIKAAMGGIAGFCARQGTPARNAVVFVVAEIVMVGGYFLFEGVLYGWAAAWAAAGPNALQGVVGVLIGSALSALPLKNLS